MNLPTTIKEWHEYCLNNHKALIIRSGKICGIIGNKNED